MKSLAPYLHVLTLSCFAVCVSNPCHSAALRVPEHHASIQEAINAASPGDTIEVGPGTYLENLWVGKRITIVSREGAAYTVIDGQGIDSVVSFEFAFADGRDVPALKGFTIRNGASAEGRGGGVTAFNSDVLLEDNVIVYNVSAMDGGGILINQRSRATVRNNDIRWNLASRFGGGIFIMDSSDPAIVGNRISDNVVQGVVIPNGGPSGGGIFADGHSSPQIVGNRIANNRAEFAGGGLSFRVGVSAYLEENEIVDNIAPYGGGVHLETEGSAPTIRSNDIGRNIAVSASQYPGSGYGGGVSIYNKTRPIIRGNTIFENAAEHGGAGVVCAEEAVAFLDSNEVRGNKSPLFGMSEGGGLYVANCNAVVVNNVFGQNEASLGAGIAILDHGEAIVANNTIVANRPTTGTAAGIPATGGGLFVLSSALRVSVLNNIIALNDDYQIFEEFATAEISTNLINDDGLGLYFNYDSHGVRDAAILNGSSAINAAGNLSGNEGFVAPPDDYSVDGSSVGQGKSQTPTLTQMDINGRLRDGAPDLGAYEHVPPAQQEVQPVPAFRFWSDAYRHHFYSVSADEAHQVIRGYSRVEWKYEGIPFFAYPVDSCKGLQVHRFWSAEFSAHFYTISSDERDHIINTYAENTWKYEGPAFCAFISAVEGTVPLYRFWSDRYRGHFFTADEAEKDFVIDSFATDEWLFEGVAFYVLPGD